LTAAAAAAAAARHWAQFIQSARWPGRGASQPLHPRFFVFGICSILRYFVLDPLGSFVGL
jgi:hypothetical protein